MCCLKRIFLVFVGITVFIMMKRSTLEDAVFKVSSYFSDSLFDAFKGK